MVNQSKKYYHSLIGVNSRLDSIQAVILDVKLKYLDKYCEARRRVADFYDAAFASIKELQTPVRATNSSHVFHQYTLKTNDNSRNELQKYLGTAGIPSMIYYPIPLYRQEAFKQYVEIDFSLPITEKLCNSVISLPIHTEMAAETQEFIVDKVKTFYV